MIFFYKDFTRYVTISRHRMSRWLQELFLIFSIVEKETRSNNVQRPVKIRPVAFEELGDKPGVIHGKTSSTK